MESVKRIVVADMGVEYRKSLIRTLSDEPDLQIIGETGDGPELLRLTKELQPDALVMEMVLTGMDGLDVLDELSKLKLRPKVLILSGYIKGGTRRPPKARISF